MAEGIDINTIQNQLNYLKETKAQMKQSLINKGQVIDETVSFRDYSKGIDKLGTVKQFASIEEMQADTENDEGAIAVVYKASVTDIEGWDSTVSGGLCLTKTVEADGHASDVVQSSGCGYMSSNSGPVESAQFSFVNDTDPTLNVTGCLMCYRDASSTYWGRLRFTYKGKNYIYSMTPKFITTNKYTTVYEAEFELPDDEPIYLIGSDVGTYTINYTTNNAGAIRTPSAVIKLMKQAIFQFGGLFTYRKDKQKWLDAQTQLSATPDLALNSTFMGSRGISTGTLDAEKQITDETTSDILAYCDKYVKLYSTINTSNVTNFSNLYKNLPKTMYGIDFIKVTNLATNTANMFNSMLNLKVLDTSKWDTSNVTNMAHMFNNCGILSLNMFNIQGAQNLSGMFKGCRSLTSLAGINNSKFGNVTPCTLDSMFENCESIAGISLAGSSWGNVTSTVNMFQNCYRLKDTQLYSFGSNSIVNAHRMFANCNSLSTWSTAAYVHHMLPEAKDVSYMYYRCTSLPYINYYTGHFNNTVNASHMYDECTKLSHLGTNGMYMNEISNMSRMFYNCYSLSNAVLRGNSYNVQDISYMFFNCLKLKQVPQLMRTNMNNLVNAAYAFYNCQELEGTGLSTWNMPNLTNIVNMFDNCFNLTNVYFYQANLPKLTSFFTFRNCNMINYLNLAYAQLPNVTALNFSLPNLTYGEFYALNAPNATSFRLCNTQLSNITLAYAKLPNLTTLHGAFQGSTMAKDINISNVNMSNITSLAYAFHGCANLLNLNCNNWDTSNVTSMAYMFHGCTNLGNFQISNWNVDNVTNMAYMFNSCKNISNLNLMSWNTPNLTNAASMFRSMGYNNIELLMPHNMFTNVNDISLAFAGTPKLNWNTVASLDMSNVINATQAFSWIDGQGDSLDILNINICNATNTQAMFQSTGNISLLNLSNWNISTSKNLANLFRDCYNLGCIDVTGWNTSNVTDISYLFAGTGFTNINSQTFKGLDTWDLSNVTSYKTMFYYSNSIHEINLPNLTFNNMQLTGYIYFALNCHQLQHINLDNWSLPKVTRHQEFLRYCKWANADISMRNWNVPNLTDTYGLFFNCWGTVNSVDFSGWYIPNLTSFSLYSLYTYGYYAYTRSFNMANWYAPNLTSVSFSNQQNLHTVNLSNVTVGNITSTAGMFNSCVNLASLDLSGTTFANVTSISNMFSRCNKLSDPSVDGIINCLLNMSSLPAEAKVLSTTTAGSPFYASNITSARYSSRVSELESAGWTI